MRRFIDADVDHRCEWSITLGDGSKAQCGRSRSDGNLCWQHKRIADAWHCNSCGGNDELPPDHCMDCETRDEAQEVR